MPRSLTDLSGLNVDTADFLAAMLEAAGQPMWVVDGDGLIRFANPAALAALGYNSADELFGRHSHETIHYQHPDGAPYPTADCPMLLPQTTGEVVKSDLDWFFRRDGSMFPVSYVSVPLEMPDGRGAVVAFSDIEDRLRAEQVLREHDAVLAAREGSLRRIATLVAGGAASGEVFAAIAREVAQVLGMALVVIWRYNPDRPASVLGAWSDRPHPFQTGTGWPVEERTAAALLPKIGRPTRIEDFGEIGGAIPDAIRATGIRSGSGAAIVVDGEFWGVMGAGVAEGRALGDHIEDRLAEFTELVATAIANTESHARADGLATEQAALRRVATLVAQGVPASELFGAVSEAVGRLLGTDLAGLLRYESDGTVTALGGWSAAGEHVEVGGRWPLDPRGMEVTISRTGRPARIDDLSEVPGRTAAVARDELGIGSSVGCPIVVERRVWGALFVHSTRAAPLPADTESRLENFTELVATAIANSDARLEVERLAEEQAALRRVAELVARESPPDDVFRSVAEELGRLLRVEYTQLWRYEPDGTATVVGTWGWGATDLPVGLTVSLEGDSVSARVRQTEAPARMDGYANAEGPFAAFLHEAGIRSAAGGPVVVAGRCWGSLVAATKRAEPLPVGTEERILEFTELVATAISSSEARSDLAASRARIVATTDDTRRRFERDLHDGVQQRLVSLALGLANTEALAPPQHEQLRRQLTAMREGLAGVLDDLRELSRGIHPAILSEGGLDPALKALCRRSAVPVKLDLRADTRLDERVEVAAYYVVSEALTNAAKHAQASVAEVHVEARSDTLDLTIHDDGIGRAHPSRGSGLIGLSDRVEALGGTIEIVSPTGEGTTLRVQLPVDAC